MQHLPKQTIYTQFIPVGFTPMGPLRSPHYAPRRPLAVPTVANISKNEESISNLLLQDFNPWGALGVPMMPQRDPNGIPGWPSEPRTKNLHSVHRYKVYAITYIHTYIHTFIKLHYNTLHYTTIRYIALHYITLHHITLHYITLHYVTSHHITSHCITLHYITIHTCITDRQTNR